MMSSGLASVLPDDRPVTSLCVVELATRCPANFTPVVKTYDQDVDADLWKDGFWRRETRYLCLSKHQSNPGALLAVDQLAVIGERDTLPHGHVQLVNTADTGNRSWKRRQLVFRVSAMSSVPRYVVDIIVLSRQKTCPAGFCLIGELNGLTICCKYANNPTFQLPQLSTTTPAHLAPSHHIPAVAGGAVLNGPGSTLAHTYSALDGVGFSVHCRLQSELARRSAGAAAADNQLAAVTADYPLTEQALDQLVSYDFSTEYAVIQQS